MPGPSSNFQRSDGPGWDESGLTLANVLAIPDAGPSERLGDKELGMLQLFAREPGRVFSRADILDEVWGMDVNPVARTVDNYILTLRRIIEPDPEHPAHLLTVRGEGWQYRRA